MGEGENEGVEESRGWDSADARQFFTLSQGRGGTRPYRDRVKNLVEVVKNSFPSRILRQYFGRSIRLLDLYVA